MDELIRFLFSRQDEAYHGEEESSTWRCATILMAQLGRKELGTPISRDEREIFFFSVKLTSTLFLEAMIPAFL